MKKLCPILATLLCITLHGLDSVDSKDWKTFQQKFPHVAAVTNHNKKAVAEFKDYINEKEAYARYLSDKERVKEKIQKNNTAAQGIAALLPVVALAGTGLRCIDWKSLVKQITKQALINGTINVTCSAIEQNILPEYLQKYTSTEISKCGATMYIDIRDILKVYAYHIEKNGLAVSADNTQKYAALVAGACISNIHKNESNYTLRLPGTNFIILRDNQTVRIAARSAGHLVAQGKIPIKKEVAYEVLKNTFTEVSYNTIAQLLHKVAQQFEVEEHLEPFIPQNCNPQNTWQLGIKMGISWLIHLGMSGEFNFNCNLEKTNLSGCI